MACATNIQTKPTTASEIVVHDKAEHMPQLPVGSIVRLRDGSLLSYSGGTAKIYASFDDGAHWEERELGVSGVKLADTGALLCTREGTVILASANLAARHWTWTPEISDMPGARLPTVVMRSTDGGRSWCDVQTVHSEWSGANRDIIQLASGRIVFTSMKGLTGPGRHSVLTYASDDDGRTWKASNIIDLGGNGHHDGVMEATLIERTDGSLLKYIRTNWGYFWQAESVDGGDNWHPYGPAPVAAGSAPGMLTRLASGVLSLVYNQPGPADGSPIQACGGDRQWSATPACNYRRELSIAFSTDEGATWSAPTVIARRQKGEVCYPHVLEVTPGRLWITAHRFGLAMAISEAELRDG